MKRLAAVLLERALGPERAGAILGDLEEDLARDRRASPTSWTASVWLLWQAVILAAAVRWADRRLETPEVIRSRQPLELTAMWHDVRNAIRSLQSAPTFTAVALVVLTLGIGASTAMFSVVDAVVLRGLPYEEPDRLVQITTYNTRIGGFGSYESPQNFADWKAQQNVFSAIAAVTGASGFTVTENGVPRDLPTLRVTAGYFDVYRVRPQLGRAFTEENEIDGRHQVALISDGLWRRLFGADPQVIGRTLLSSELLVMGAPKPVPAGTWTIIGVMPRGFRSPVSAARQTDVWVPYVVPEYQRTRGDSRSSYLQVSGRLRNGVTIGQADAQIRTITARLAEEFPKWFPDEVGAVRSLHEATVGRVRAWMLLLLGAVGVVLLIACVNVANLMLARAAARTREIQVRAALGASPWQIARGLLVESLVLSTAGTLLALVAAWWGIDVLRAALPQNLPRISTVSLDLRVLGAAALAALATGLLFGLAPALQFSRASLSGALRESRGTTAGRARLRSALVVAEIALALVLTVGAGLFLSSFVKVTNVDVGLDYRNVLTMDVWPRIDSSKPGWVEPAVARAAATIPEIVDRVAAIPGVVSAGFIAGGLPLSGNWDRTDVTVPGREQPFDGDDSVDIRQVTPGYARAVGTPVLRGRYVEPTDTRGSAPVVVLNEEAATRYLSDREPLGATITINRQNLTVVGIVGNVRLGGPESAVRPEAYVPAPQGRYLGGTLAIRTAGDPMAIADPVREAIWASLPGLAAPEAETMESLLGALIAQRRFNMLIVSLFGGLALAIASAGIYGVMAYLVTQRTKEIGVRMALGALPARVMSAVIGRALLHTCAGLAIGVVGAWQLASSIERFLFQVEPYDPGVYGAAAALLAVSGFAAAYVPARRAARVDPVIALRTE
ncbi:MAG TPA: ABC transporter permease [Vicinamibacterales bacterium]|nr:ABC transporter permease [Vicinamibacterales bacterium]